MSMKSVACVLFLALCLTHAAGLKSSLTFDEEGAKNRPVAKVTNLLKDMLKQLEKEGEDDEEVYDQMACWCETYDKEKTKSIASGEARIGDLTAKIEELTGLSAQLNTEIKILSEEVAKNQEALDEATAMREKQLAEFTAEEKEMLFAISALKQAVTVLKKQNSASSMLQMPQVQLMRVAATMQYQMSKHAALLQDVFTDSQHQEVAAFIQSPEDYFDAEPTFKQSYAPKSNAIFGILSQMKETFETNLSSSQKEEAENLKAYEELKSAKETEITAGQEQVDAKTIELADTDEKNAEAKEDLADTQATLVEDEKFLAMLKSKCQDIDAQWEERQKTRQLEMEATSKALEILTGDEAHDMFSKTFNPAFVQKQSSTHSSRRSRASELLKNAAKKMNKPKLAALAYRVHQSLTPDAFAKVEKAIDGMIGDLGEEKAEEIKHKEFCVDEFNKNALDTERRDREKEDLVAKIEDLDMTIKMLTDTITMLESDIFDMNKQLKTAGEERAKQNKEFQQTVADQRATQVILKKALTVLEGFYGKKAAALVQKGKQSVGQAPPPPPGFSDYKKNAASGGVMGMIQKIIDDAATMEAEATRSEEESQQAYDDFVKETKTSIDTKTKDITNKSEEKAKAEADKVEAVDDKETTMIKLEQLSQYNTELHESCDFTVKNFETRQTARDEEVEALRQAMAILSGAKFESFLQY